MIINRFLNKIKELFEKFSATKVGKFLTKRCLFDTFMRAAMVFLLFSVDFVLFASSGDLNIFRGYSFSTEIMYIIAFFAFLISIMFVIFVKLPIVQNILVSLGVILFVYALYNQFAEFDPKNFIGEWFGVSNDNFFGHYSDVFVAAIFGFLAFLFYSKNNRYHILYITFLVLFLFCSILISKLLDTRIKNEFVISYNDNIGNKNDQLSSRKVVYIFLPEASSYKYISSLNMPEAQKTKNIMLAFYAKNNFDVYPNAHVDGKGKFFDMVKMLNSKRSTDAIKNIMQTRLLYKYWRFFNLKNENIYLQNNDLFDAYKNSGFGVSAYKSWGIDLCHKNHEINVNRCVERINKPVNIYDKKIGKTERAKVIFAEWLESTWLFGDLSWLYNFFKVFTDIDKTPLIGINYNNLYVINSIDTLNKLFNDIISDKGNHAYFVMIDMPADMYIYDEFCQIKPTSAWISRDNLPWVKTSSEDVKKMAYLQQTQCLYGKMEEFMQKLQKSEMLDNTDIIIQGVSTYGTGKETNSYVENFIEKQLINMAYRKAGSDSFFINDNICRSSDILNSLLYGDKMCEDLEGVNVHISIKKEIVAKLQNENISSERLNEIIDDFDSWYAVWLSKNGRVSISNDDEEIK